LLIIKGSPGAHNVGVLKMKTLRKPLRLRAARSAHKEQGVSGVDISIHAWSVTVTVVSLQRLANVLQLSVLARS
jgi:hypothetical protein